MENVTQQDLDIVFKLRKSNEDSVKDQDQGLAYDIQSVETISVPGQGGEIPVILYTPREIMEGGMPAFINIHGGGFIMAHAYMDGPFCRRIASQAGCLVINVEYRLAPEHPFPAGLEDCYSVVRWVYENAEALHVNPRKIAVGGYSAGGNLSAAVCLLAKERGEFPVQYQVLCYAPFDLSFEKIRTHDAPKNDTITQDAANLINHCYLRDLSLARSPLASPVYAENLRGLPDALIIVGELDGLAKGCAVYADKLRGDGVAAELKVYPGMRHAFTHEPCAAADDAWNLICARLRGMI